MSFYFMIFEENGGSRWIFITTVVKTSPFIGLERRLHWQWLTRDRNWVSQNLISDMIKTTKTIKKDFRNCFDIRKIGKVN